MIVERVLAAAALAAALTASWGETGSPLASCIRDSRPWTAWLEARQPAPAPAATMLAFYDPTHRRLSVLQIPGAPAAAQERGRSLLAGLASGRASEPAARLEVDLPRLGEQDEPVAEAALALKARAPKVWASRLRAALRGLRAGERDALDPLFFTVELRRMPLEGLRPVVLPKDASADLLARIVSAEDAPQDGKTITAEVLNGTSETGLASRASKMLRLRGVDVMAIGGTLARARTVVYDRTGDFRRAAAVRAALPCPSPRLATRLDPSRAVDASVELGDDCADMPGRDAAGGF